MTDEESDNEHDENKENEYEDHEEVASLLNLFEELEMEYMSFLALRHDYPKPNGKDFTLFLSLRLVFHCRSHSHPLSS